MTFYVQWQPGVLGSMNAVVSWVGPVRVVSASMRCQWIYLHITSFKVRVCVSVHRQPTPAVSWRILCAGIHLGLRRRGSGRWEGQHDGDGDTQSQDEDPRQHVGGGLGDCQGHTCTTPKRLLMTPRRPRRSEAGRSFCHMRVLSQTCLLSGSQSVFMNVSADFQDQLVPWDRFGSCMLEKSV